MAARLKRVDPQFRPGWLSRAAAAIANTRFGRFFSKHVVWKVDPWLMRVSGERLGFGVGIPTALLETTGAKSGATRRNGVIYFHDGNRVTIVASKIGLDHHPAWFHNLVADPEVTLAGIPMRATVVEDDVERRRLWDLADRVFAPYATYRREAAESGREIPIVQLTPREAGAGA
jgi:deazaflavin-dependent oxidoreductase (nitroreductase family)